MLSPTRTLGTVALALAAAAFYLVAGAAPGAGASGGDDLLGQPAPEIAAEGWLNAKGPVSLGALKGKPAVVEFWATWCPPCRRSIPRLAGLHEKYKGDGITIIGLTDEDSATVEEFMKTMSMPYVVGYGSKTAREYGVRGIPTAFVVGADGKVLWTGHPMEPELEEAIERAIAAAGAKKG